MSTQDEVEGVRIPCVEPVSNTLRLHRHVKLTVSTWPSTICMAAVGMVFWSTLQGQTYLATIDMVSPVSSTFRYPCLPSQIRTQNTTYVLTPERPCQNSSDKLI